MDIFRLGFHDGFEHLPQFQGFDLDWDGDMVVQLQVGQGVGMGRIALMNRRIERGRVPLCGCRLPNDSRTFRMPLLPGGQFSKSGRS